MELTRRQGESIGGCGIGDEDERIASFAKVNMKLLSDLLSAIFYLFAVPGDARLRE